MQEVFEKIKQKLEEENKRSLNEMYRLHGNNYETVLLKKHNDSICEIVDQVAEEYNNGWIPCSERLPEERGWCLAVFKEPDTDFVLIPRVAEYLLGLRTLSTTEDGWVILDCTDKDDACEYYKKLKCIAWQPLPAPPKKEV